MSCRSCRNGRGGFFNAEEICIILGDILNASELVLNTIKFKLMTAAVHIFFHWLPLLLGNTTFVFFQRAHYTQGLVSIWPFATHLWRCHA